MRLLLLYKYFFSNYISRNLLPYIYQDFFLVKPLTPKAYASNYNSGDGSLKTQKMKQNVHRTDHHNLIFN